MAFVDLLLAILHHFLVFALVGLLAAELSLLRPGLSGTGLALLGRIDAAYGGIAMAIIVVGVARVFFGLKGWEYYVSNHAFWSKMVAFIIVGILSIRPTKRILSWRRNGVDPVPERDIQAVRTWVKGEMFFVVLVIIFAAAMARGL